MDNFGIDSHKLHLHPGRVAQWLEAGDDWEKAKKVMPLYWEVTTSGACNHRCTFCSVDAIGYEPINIDAGLLGERMAEAARLGVKSVMFAGTGEPLVHKHISRITEMATGGGLDAAFTTNGVLLDRLSCVDKCTWIKVSLNAGTRESYAAIHQTKPEDWDKVWSGIERAVKRKGKCTIGVQCVVLEENVYDMRTLASMCVDAGVDYLVLKPYTQATFMISRKHEGVDYSKMRSYLEAVKDFDTPTFKVIYRSNAINQEISGKHHYERCRATPNFWVYSMADGRVFTCSAHLLDDRFCIGNLNERSFQEIWEGEKRRINWEMMQSFNIKQCRLNCRMDKQNRYLADFSRTAHVNFI